MLDPTKAIRIETLPLGNRHRRLFIFKCLGGCGSEIKIRSGEFHHRHSTGMCRRCACGRPNVRFRLRPYEWTYRGMLASAQNRGISVNLTYEEFLGFTTALNCHYCGIEIHWNPFNKKKSKQGKGSNLDRKDSHLGYFKENLVVCCAMCNRIKNNHLSYEEMLLLAPVLRRIQTERKENSW